MPPTILRPRLGLSLRHTSRPPSVRSFIHSFTHVPHDVPERLTGRGGHSGELKQAPKHVRGTFPRRLPGRGSNPCAFDSFYLLFLHRYERWKSSVLGRIRRWPQGGRALRVAGPTRQGRGEGFWELRVLGDGQQGHGTSVLSPRN